MSNHIEIHIAELFVGSNDCIITTNGVGSCIVIILYDRLMHVGGMAHVILPKKKDENEEPLNYRDKEGRYYIKYVDQAIETLIEEITLLGGSTERLVAKLVGGAHMFVLLEGDKHGIGWENANVAREELARVGIPIETEVVGGTVGRNVSFDCSTGIVEIITKV